MTSQISLIYFIGLDLFNLIINCRFSAVFLFHFNYDLYLKLFTVSTTKFAPRLKIFASPGTIKKDQIGLFLVACPGARYERCLLAYANGRARILL